MRNLNHTAVSTSDTAATR